MVAAPEAEGKPDGSGAPEPEPAGPVVTVPTIQLVVPYSTSAKFFIPFARPCLITAPDE